MVGRNLLPISGSFRSQICIGKLDSGICVHDRAIGVLYTQNVSGYLDRGLMHYIRHLFVFKK